MSTPNLDAWSSAQENREFFDGLTAEQIRDMPASEYARRTGRPTPAQAAHAAPNQAEPAPAGRSGAPAGDSIRSNAGPSAAVSGLPASRPFEEANEGGDEGFLAWRAQRRSGGEGQGLFSGLGGSSSAEYQAAASRQSGRNALVQSNVTGPAVPMGREQMIANMRAGEAARLDNRADRFRTPGNGYQG